MLQFGTTLSLEGISIRLSKYLISIQCDYLTYYWFRIGEFTSIGDNTVVHTAASLPTGMVAKCTIKSNCTIGSNCTLYSCLIEEDSVVGDNSVILEGAILQKGCQIAPGSVVPPGRLIPTKQLWGGNPVKFMKDLDVGESWANYTKSYVISALGETLKDEFTLWNSSYMDRVSY